MLLKEKRVGNKGITVSIIIILFLGFLAVAFGQNADVHEAVAKSEVQELETSQVLKPAFSEYKGISIGTTEAELLERIGTKPAFESKDDYFYIFSAVESAQFVLDEERKVRVISIIYSGNDSNAPMYGDVLGSGVDIKMTKDGNVYNLVNYPDAGFWVAYYKSTGDNAMVTITIQKL